MNLTLKVRSIGFGKGTIGWLSAQVDKVVIRNESVSGSLSPQKPYPKQVARLFLKNGESVLLCARNWYEIDDPMYLVGDPITIVHRDLYTDFTEAALQALDDLAEQARNLMNDEPSGVRFVLSPQK